VLRPCRVLSDDEMSGLKLISKTRNGPYKPIYKEELPSILHGNSPRQLLGKKWFDDYTNDLLNLKVCQGCGKPLNGFGERHELYGLYLLKFQKFNHYVIKLEGVMKLCSSCHKSIHYGFSFRLGMKSGFIPLQSPESPALKIGPWSKAKFILVGNQLFSL
jgi:hypothetical protein